MYPNDRTLSKCCDNTLEFDVESLEQRTMLAGDVSVRVNGNDVFVDGSAEADQLSIGYSGDNGSYTVSALEDSDTTINGQDEYATGLNSIGRLIIRMRGGDDSLTFRNIEVTERAGISLGSSEVRNEVAFNNGVEIEKLQIRGGRDSDWVTMGSSSIYDGMNLRMGGGNDFVNISGVADLTGKCTIKMGAGDDNVMFSPPLATVDRALILGNGGQDSLRIPAYGIQGEVLTYRSFETVTITDPI